MGFILSMRPDKVDEIRDALRRFTDEEPTEGRTTTGLEAATLTYRRVTDPTEFEIEAILHQATVKPLD